MTTNRASLISRELEVSGVSKAVGLSRSLGLSQASISLAIKELGRRVIVFGKARSSRYALSRDIGREGDRWPLYSINVRGLPELAGQLVALHQREWAFIPEPEYGSVNFGEFSDGLYPDLPWFLDTLRPQGFLGRNFAQTISLQIGLPPDPGNWAADDVIAAALRNGYDFPGSFILGDEALEKAQTAFINDAESESSREFRYPELALQSLNGEFPRSSAGGEQPKFTAYIKEEDVGHVVVKFSGQTDSPSDKRWRDLLISEQLASESINVTSVAVAKNRIFPLKGRIFLESERFDRVGDSGRRFVVSLSALDGAFYGKADTPWTAAADRLSNDKLISVRDARCLKWLWWYGNLIGNDDMHYGNISLLLDGQGAFELAPCYDMLPMRYRPTSTGEIVHQEPKPKPPLPQDIEIWRSAAASALEFWERVRKENRISNNFSEIALTNLQVIKKLRERFD